MSRDAVKSLQNLLQLNELSDPKRRVAGLRNIVVEERKKRR